VLFYKPLGMQASIFGACSKPGKLEGLQQGRHPEQNGGMMEVGR